MEQREIEIPKLFSHSETGRPFSECLMCKRNLSAGDIDYMIEKVVRNIREFNSTEILFEYAMCIECVMKMRAELSEESRSRIDNYFADNLNFESRRARMNSENVDDWVADCVVKGTPVEKSSEYSIYAHCRGDKLVQSDLPYALSGEVMDEVMQLLSNKSLDILDDFTGKHFSGPPEVRELLRRRPVFI